MNSPGGTHNNTLPRAFTYALVGVLLALALHGYYVARWDRYVSSVSRERIRQRAGVAPDAYIAGTTRSARDGALVLLATAAVVVLVSRRSLLACGAFAAGAAAVNVMLGLVVGKVLGNLWPLATIAVLLLTIVPIAVGAALGGGLRMLRSHRKSETVAVLVVGFLLIGSFMRCSSAPSAPGAASTTPTAAAELSVAGLVPHPGATLTHSSIFEVSFNYRLTGMKPTATYILQPAFSDRRGAGYTFNAVSTPADVITLTTPEGIVEMRYPIIREWTNKRLALPIELWFQIIERESSRGRVIATVGPYRYTGTPEEAKK